MPAQLEVFPTVDRLADAAARRIADRAAAAVAGRGAFTVALAGGQTPSATYARLADPDLRDRVPWSRVHVFWTDERPVGPSHPDSNYRMAREALLDHVPLPPSQVHRIQSELGPGEAAAAYSVTLSAVLGAAGLDLVILGLGADGHVASLFPGAAALAVGARGAVVCHSVAGGPWRVSMTLPELDAAAEVLGLVHGADKADAMAAVRAGRQDVPGARVTPVAGHVRWFVDRATADAVLARSGDGTAPTPDLLAARKRAAAEAATENVASGMRLGLGTGSTARYVVDAIGRRLRSGDLVDVVGVPTSDATADIARAAGVPLTDLADAPALDLAIDGADEVAPDLAAIKGLGGALVREKIVAAASERFLLVADVAKLVDRLGTRAPLPVAVLPFAWQGHLQALQDLGAEAALRRRPDGQAFLSDDGLYMLDARFANGIADPDAIEAALRARPGVVGTGLFIGLAEAAYVADDCGVLTFRR